jgi:hypothetical protein
MLYSKVYRSEDYRIIINILEENLKGKIISFTNRIYKIEYVHTQLKKGKVVEVAYDNDDGNQTSYVRIKNDNEWYSICNEEPIYIHNTESDADKYNL